MLIEAIGWRAAFLINVPIGLFAIWLTPATRTRQTGSVLGVALFGSLLATGVVGGLHASLAISIALLLATGALALVLP